MQVFNRSEIFKQSSFVDNQIAFAQQATYRTINQDDPDEVAYMMPFLDHLQAFKPMPKKLNEFAVLAFDAENKEDYENKFPLIMVEFYSALKIEQVYILTEIKTDWKDLIFENEEKKAIFLKQVNEHTHAVGYLVEVKDLPEILPLFFFMHPDYPHIELIPAQANINIVQFLCKDGNLHTLFEEQKFEQLKAVAEASGLVMGSFEVCQLYNKY